MAVRPTRPRCARSLVLGVTVVAVVAIGLIGWAHPPTAGAASVGALGTIGSTLPAGVGPTGGIVAASNLGATTAPTLALGVAVAPQAICSVVDATCAAGTNMARVTLTANMAGNRTTAWPAVEIAFVVETTLYDGVFDALNPDGDGEDACLLATPESEPCETSNGVPFFAANAQAIATAIAQANPHTQVSFALVDYFATRYDWDDGDGVEYHVDVPAFVPAANFGAAVDTSFNTEVLNGAYEYQDSDFADNFLHSSSITALYGTIEGSGLDWSPATHHVIVWMGSTAPRDPNYPENYCVSAHMGTPDAYGPCYGGTCEPAYPFPGGSSPACEGWVASQDGNVNHSIAALARTAGPCTDSIGGVCTIDAIDYWDTPTDPYSEGWPDASGYTTIGGGPGGSVVREDSANILQAGCAIAAATGGTWDGPAFWTCPNGVTGTLQYVGIGSPSAPNTQNPDLFDALKGIGFGPVVSPPVITGTDHAMFVFVPFGTIALAGDLAATASCQRNGAPFPDCQSNPTVVHGDPATYLTWNWSAVRSLNAMYLGDVWTASFNIIASGPPYLVVPVDACITATCAAAGSTAVGSLYSWASFDATATASPVTESFPVGTVHVEGTSTGSLGVPSAPGAGTAPPSPVLSPTPLPAALQFAGPGPFGFGQVSFQALAAGFLAAGFLRMTLKTKAVAIRIAANYGRAGTTPGAGRPVRRPPAGRFE